MSLLDQYNKSQLTPNPVSDTLKNTDKYTDTVVKQGSSLVKQATSPTAPTNLAPSGGTQNYTQQVFQESLN